MLGLRQRRQGDALHQACQLFLHGPLLLPALREPVRRGAAGLGLGDQLVHQVAVALGLLAGLGEALEDVVGEGGRHVGLLLLSTQPAEVQDLIHAQPHALQPPLQRGSLLCSQKLPLLQIVTASRVLLPQFQGTLQGLDGRGRGRLPPAARPGQ